MAAQARQVMLAQKLEASKDASQDPTGWIMSEKLDGVRAYWDGHNFYSRQGNMFVCPQGWKRDLPNFPLDGELWCGRGLFQKTVGIIKKQKGHNDAEWKFVHYLVFDAPAHPGKYEQRVQYLHDQLDSISLKADSPTNVTVVGTQVCKGKDHLMQQLDVVIKKGGEGIMLRRPGSAYEHCRSWNLLKLKQFHDEEALVVGHQASKTGNGSMGALECKLANGVRVKVGTGFSDADRRHPPKIGAVITFKYQEVSDSGTPRFPVFLRIREDVTWDDVLSSAKTDKPFSQLQKKHSMINKQHSILFSAIPSRDPLTGQKVVTSDDEDDEHDASSSASAAAAGPDAGKPVCKFGESCYRTNQSHLAQFAHPTKKAVAASATPAANAKIPCVFGKACYRRGASHLSAFSHPDLTGDLAQDIDPDILKTEHSDDEGDSNSTKRNEDASDGDDDDDTQEDETLAPKGAAKAASRNSKAEAATASSSEMLLWLQQRAGLDADVASNVCALLQKEEVLNPADLQALSEQDLEKIGVKLGSRKKILMAVSAQHASASSVADAREVCMYGAGCTRTSASHFEKYSHGPAVDRKRPAESSQLEAAPPAAKAARTTESSEANAE